MSPVPEKSKSSRGDRLKECRMQSPMMEEAQGAERKAECRLGGWQLPGKALQRAPHELSPEVVKAHRWWSSWKRALLHHPHSKWEVRVHPHTCFVIGTEDTYWALTMCPTLQSQQSYKEGPGWSSPIYRWGNWASRRWSDVLKIS